MAPGRARRVTAIPLERRLPGASSNLPGRPDLDIDPGTPPPLARRLSSTPSLFGFAPGGVCRAARVTASAVRSYRTVSPLPYPSRREGSRRFVFCGTVPGVAPAGRYPAPYVRGARTFLPGPSLPPRERRSGLPGRPPGRLTTQGMGGGERGVKT